MKTQRGSIEAPFKRLQLIGQSNTETMRCVGVFSTKSVRSYGS